MLILTRKIDQSIIIQDDITVVVLGVERDRVKLGIQAPADVAVLREELQAASEVAPPSQLRPRTARPSRAATSGNLALKPESKD